MNQRQLLAFALMFLLVAPPLSAQQQQQRQAPAAPSVRSSTIPPPPQKQAAQDDDEVVRITANLVQVDVIVTGKDGKPVADLRPEDFEIYEDGRLQQITNFSYITTTGPAILPASPPSASAPATAAARTPRVAVPPVPLRRAQVQRTVALVVDDLGTAQETLPPTRAALRKFVDEQMGPNDLAAVVRTGTDIGPLQQFTSDKRLLHAAINQLRWNPCSRVGVNVFTPIGSGGGVSQTAMRQCAAPGYSLTASLRALNAVVRGMRELPGRKSMLVFSDSLSFGVDDPRAGENDAISFVLQEVGGAGSSTGLEQEGVTGSLYQRYKLIAEQAIRSSVVIYGVDTRGLQITSLTAADNLNLSPGSISTLPQRTQSILSSRSRTLLAGRDGTAFLAEETGGFLVRNSNDITGGVRRINEDQKGYYLIGYRPRDETFDRRFHKIKARVKTRKGLDVRTRSGFYGLTEEEITPPPARTPADRLLLTLMSPFSNRDIGLRLTPIFDHTPATGSLLRALVHIDSNNLTFIEETDGAGRLDLAVQGILFGDNGKPVADHRQSYSIRLTGDALRRVRTQGLDYTLEMPATTPGAFQFRVGVFDIPSSRVGSAGHFIEVPDLKGDSLALSGLLVSGSQPTAQAAAVNAAVTANTVPAAQAVDGAGSSSGSSNADATPTARRFSRVMMLDFSYVIFNARAGKQQQQGGPPQLTEQTSLYRDGKLVLVGKERPVPLAGQTDPGRIVAGGRLPLGSELPPGDYILQVTITDTLAKNKQSAATQWIDFEIVK